MRTFVQVLCVLLMLAAVARVARADEESGQMAVYRRPVEESIDRALDFLASQMLTGPELFKGQFGNTNALAGLVGMAFLARGHVPDDNTRYGRCINICADHILNSVDPKNKDSVIGYSGGARIDGYLGSERTGENMYGHAICALFLSEISGMVDEERQRKIDAVLPKALKLLLAAQAVGKPPQYKGGWRYQPNSIDSDISVTGWCLLALRSARLNGAAVPDAAIADAIGFIERVRSPDGGFCYTDGGFASVPSRSGVGVLCRELTGHHGDEINRKAGDTIILPMKTQGWGYGYIMSNYGEYATYYCSQATFQLGSTYWEQFAEAMYNYLLPRQEKDGGWTTGEGRIYPTAMYVLALTVSCRQLPIYQR